jgi:hypothetical protein
MLRSLGWRFWLKNKKFWLAAHAQPQEMSPDKTLRSGRRRSKSEKPKAVPESPQNRRRKRIVVNTRPDVPSQESLGK